MPEVVYRYMIQHRYPPNESWDYWDESASLDNARVMVREWRTMRRNMEFQIVRQKTITFREVTYGPVD